MKISMTSIIQLFFILTTIIHFISTNDSLAIIGSELTGPNVCKRIEIFNLSVIVSEVVPYQEIRTVWCGK
jgi:hypothetical protein